MDFLTLLEKVTENSSSNPGFKTKISIVIGNESAASIAYAFLSQQYNPEKAFLSQQYNPEKGIFLPVLQIPKDELTLRPECEYVFRRHEMDSDRFIYKEDLEVVLEGLMKNNELHIVLVDHNKLVPPWDKFANCVDAILDHHEDEGLYLTASPRWIEPVGSACSLVVLSFPEVWAADQLNGHGRKLANLLLAPILIDTVCLDVSKGRTTEKDQKAANFLLNTLQISDHNAFIAEYYNEIQKARRNISHLSTHDLLRKDYKEWVIGDVRIGISSVSLSVQAWLKRDQISTSINELASYASERKLDLLIVMTTHTHPQHGFQRDLVVYPFADLLKSQEFISKMEKSDLGLETLIIDPENEDCRFYRQKNISWSRKQVYPFFRNLIESINVASL
ncbi:2335_t:CDS:2 [Ambispora gerdemannii]|uniref:2335_t:CDS:1 n=1 Tax=Ambispora gerdemannii TaxID=144530 RepID=A0A9N8Z345_9GLOM|nr:2335_t:CDS:2 [Ambispora gerdemannii]